MFKVTISSQNGKLQIVLPVITEDSLSIDYGSSNNETHDSIKYGQIKTIGKKPLASLSIDSFIPTHKYPFLSSKAKGKTETPLKSYIWWLEKRRSDRKPVRVVITDGRKKSVFNKLMTIESMSISKIDTAGDYHYSLSFEEYRKVK